MPKSNNWGVQDIAIDFFEKVLGKHTRVKSFRRSRDILFHITLKNGIEINVLLVNEYTLGLAAVFQAIEEFSEAEYVVTCGVWNAYTQEAKEYGIKNRIGIFVIDEFLGALNWDKPKEYVQRDEDGNPQYRFRAS